MRIFKCLLVIATVLACAGFALGAISSEDAKKLGTTLTRIGAEKAGNADGSIPEYTGGLTTPPAGFVKRSGLRSDPFPGEKPLFSIDAKNMAQYADKLTEGTKALMKKYPGFRIDVYKTHRTVAFPEFVWANTVKVAQTAKTAKGGDSLLNAQAGYPFPIPKDGHEAMWNHMTHFAGNAYTLSYDAYNVDSSGGSYLSSRADFLCELPYWDTSRAKVEFYARAKSMYAGPPRKNGESNMVWDPLDYTVHLRQAWSYLPGQRRVRVAPDIAFDTPDPGKAGMGTYDDIYIFNGSLERYNWKLIGKKEIYIPYNTYKFSYFQGDVKQAMGTKHLNPDLIRWELHRLWVVEATLKPGKRHIYPKRTFYLDEDSWVALSSDEYDKQGNMYRVGMAHMAPSYDVPAPASAGEVFYDLIANSYALSFWPRKGIKYVDKFPEKEFTPDSMSGAGLR